MRHGQNRRAVRTATVGLALLTTLALAACVGGSSHGTITPGRHSSPSASPRASSTATTATAELEYVALGDSYSAGMGGGDEAGACNRSPNAFPHQLATSAGLDLVAFPACAGATTQDVIDDQLGALTPDVRLVTITIGGNDLDVAALPAACAHGETRVCKAAVASSVGLLKTLPLQLTAVFGAVSKAAPNARIYVADYPAFFDLFSANQNTIDLQELPAALAVDAAVSSLDATIAKAVEASRKGGANIRFVDVSFTGHGINGSSPWFVVQGAAIYHPTEPGYARYAQTLKTVIG